MRSHPGSGPGGAWEWTEASADADGSYFESKSQMEVLEVSCGSFTEVLEVDWKWLGVGGSSRWK